jgi:hypothetical protein
MRTNRDGSRLQAVEKFLEWIKKGTRENPKSGH